MAGLDDGNRHIDVTGGADPTWAQELLDHLRPAGAGIRRVVGCGRPCP